MLDITVLMAIIGLALGTTTAYGVSKTRQKKRIHFCKSENLEKELRRFDIELEEKDICTVCEKEIKPEEIGTVFEENGEYKVVCKEEYCLDNY